MKKIRLIAFDFDGTVADSVELCLSTFDALFRETLGPQAPGRDELLQQFGRNEEGILSRYFGPRTKEMFKRFCCLHETMHKTMCPEPFPGLKEFALFLKSRGVRLVLLTGRSRETAQISMKLLGLTGVFEDFWYGSSETSSKSAQMREMLDRFHLSVEEAVYVGDAVSDVQSSSEAGLICLSAAWAKSARRADLEKVNSGLVFDSISSMREWLEARI